jgi:hypothetical protein
MKLSLSIAEKLLLMTNGERIPYSQLKNEVINELISDGVLYKHGKQKSVIQLIDNKSFNIILQTRFGISDLNFYIETLKKVNPIRSELVESSSNSKLKTIRTFKGFLVNSYLPINAFLNGESIIIKPNEGLFQFIHDFENFIPKSDVTIIGIENPENFRQIVRQQYLFQDLKPLFVSRYPQNQSKDLIKWLQTIPNSYLHFGDFDFAGINIYLNEFKKKLGDKATFFVPEDTENKIIKFGNRKLYDVQSYTLDSSVVLENNLQNLISILHKHKKGLEQEIFIR